MIKAGGILIDETLRWKNKQGQEVYLSDSCQFIRDKDGNKEGVRGILIDIWYKKVFDELNEGIYKIGKDQETLIKANHALAKMFGYKYPEEMEGLNIRNLYKNPMEMDKYKEKLFNEGRVRNYSLEMLERGNQGELVVSVNAIIIKDEAGNIIGREGTLRDITDLYRIQRILEDMPTGAYQVKRKGDKEIISYCNNAFAQMFGYSKPEEVVGEEAKVFHASEESAEKFRNELIEKDSKNESLLDYRLFVKKKVGEVFWAEIDCQLLKDHKGNIIGRQGTLRDATLKIQLEEMLRRKEDIQRFSHRFMAPIMSIKSSAETLMEEIKQLIEWELFSDSEKILKNLKGDPFTFLKSIKELSKMLAARLEEFLATHNKEGQNFMVEVQYFISKLREFSNEKRIDDIIELRETQRETRNCLYKYHISESELKFEEGIGDILNFLEDLDKIYVLYIAQTITNTSKIAYTDVENLRSYLSGWTKGSNDVHYEFKKENLYDCIKEVVNIYQIYAFEKEIAIEIFADMLLEIEMSKEDLIKMFHNLIQNAVKYSYNVKQNIRIRLDNLVKDVAIEIANYGVGILPAEIEKGKIFEYGYRGKLSSDWNRTGSGIGLSEAKKIAKKHGGDITVTSTPVGTVKGDPKVPYITKVRVTLPKFHS
jgi:PAS domain S-box-containing protein